MSIRLSPQSPLTTWKPEQIEALAKSSDKYPVSFDDAWQWIGYTRKDNAKRALQNNFKEGLDYKVFLRAEENSLAGRPSDPIRLTTTCFKKFCMMAGTEQGEAILQMPNQPSINMLRFPSHYL